MRPGRKEIVKIWDWTRKDVEELFKPFFVPLEPGNPGFGPSNGYAIYLFSMMDLWGSIIRNKFGLNEGRQNVASILESLVEKYPNTYDYTGYQVNDLADKLRNNLAHNYGLRVIKSNEIDEWLEIGVNLTGKIIFINDSKRIQIDCQRLKNHILEIIKEWLKANNYI